MINRKTLFELGFKPPFRASGLWVTDCRGENVCETTTSLALAIAETLNRIQTMSDPKRITKI